MIVDRIIQSSASSCKQSNHHSGLSFYDWLRIPSCPWSRTDSAIYFSCFHLVICKELYDYPPDRNTCIQFNWPLFVGI